MGSFTPVRDSYGYADNNPSAIYMAVTMGTDALDVLPTRVLHDNGVSNLSLATAWDDPRFDVRRLMSRFIALLIEHGADNNPVVAHAIDVARHELREN